MSVIDQYMVRELVAMPALVICVWVFVGIVAYANVASFKVDPIMDAAAQRVPKKSAVINTLYTIAAVLLWPVAVYAVKWLDKLYQDDAEE